MVKRLFSSGYSSFSVKRVCASAVCVNRIDSAAVATSG
jgi:hypothetical protein